VAPLSATRVLVCGASSQVGVFAMPRLVAAGWRVSAVSRRGRPDWCPEWDEVEWIEPGARPAEPPGALLSAGPLDAALDWLREWPSIRRVAATSTSSVLVKADSPDPGERELVAGILMRERELEALCRQRAVPLLLLRPTLIYGCGMDRNLSLLADFIRRFGFCPVSSEAHGRRQPLHAEDLAVALQAGLETDPKQWGTDALVSPLCGSSTLAYRSMVERLFPALGRPVRVLPLPPGLFMATIRAGSRIGGVRLTPAMVTRQGQHLEFDDRIARSALGVVPRPFRPGALDFQLPEPARLASLAVPGGGSIDAKMMD
jgi:uncharacterized protein YbjT (DUF2867 family)